MFSLFWARPLRRRGAASGWSCLTLTDPCGVPPNEGFKSFCPCPCSDVSEVLLKEHSFSRLWLAGCPE